MPVKFLTVSQGRIPYEVFPASGSATAGPTFVCVPGLGDLRSEYRWDGGRPRYLQPLLSSIGRVILCDLRGLGEESTDVFATQTPEDSGRDIVTLLEAEGVADAVLVGCSYAGASVVFAAATAPGRVVGAVLLSPFAWDHPMPFGVPTLLWMLMNGCTGPSFWSSYYKGLHKRAASVPDLDAHTARVRALLASSSARVAAVHGQIAASKATCAALLPALAAAHLPVLAVYGAADPDFSDVGKEAAEAVSRLGGAPAAASLVVPEAGHYPHVEDPERVAAAVADFARRLPGRG